MAGGDEEGLIHRAFAQVLGQPLAPAQAGDRPAGDAMEDAAASQDELEIGGKRMFFLLPLEDEVNS